MFFIWIVFINIWINIIHVIWIFNKSFRIVTRSYLRNWYFLLYGELTYKQILLRSDWCFIRLTDAFIFLIKIHRLLIFCRMFRNFWSFSLVPLWILSCSIIKFTHFWYNLLLNSARCPEKHANIVNNFLKNFLYFIIEMYITRIEKCKKLSKLFSFIWR